jgi:hypothetical protein
VKPFIRLLGATAGAALLSAVAFAVPAQAQNVPVEASGEFSTEVPATPPASLTITAGGQTKEVGVPGTAGGALTLRFVANQNSSVDVVTSDCPVGQAGKVITVSGFSKGTLVSAGFTSPQTGTISTPPTIVDRSGGATAALCGFLN